MSKPTFKAKPMQVQVPASSANLGPGFDSFGLALGMHDRYVAQVLDDVTLDIDVTGEGADEVPRNDKNLLVKAMYKGFDYLGGRPKGLAIRALNVNPHGRGLGSSASAIIGGLVLGLVNSFSKTVKPAMAIAYAAFQGLALGTISNLYNTAYNGIVSQAILVTLSAFAGMLFAFKSGRIRVTPKFTKVLMTALIGYLVLAVVSLVSSLITGTSIYSIGGLGLIIATGGMVLAAFFLILDFDSIQKGIAAGAPESESWRAAFGLMVTIVWLYLEVLRVLSILRGDD